jgi:hypothetical protein
LQTADPLTTQHAIELADCENRALQIALPAFGS